MTRAIIVPGIGASTSGLKKQPLVEPPAAFENAYYDLIADVLHLGDPGPVWPDRASSARGVWFSSNRPRVVDEGGRQFVRFSENGVGSSVGDNGVSNSGNITKFVRFRFPNRDASGSICGVRGAGTPNIYIAGGSGNVTINRGGSHESTVDVNDGEWHNLIAVFTTTGSVLNVDGVETTRAYTPTPSPEAGFTLNYWSGSIYDSRVLDVARAGHFQGAANQAARGRILEGLTNNG